MITSTKTSRVHGFTLVELLVAISIISILAALVLGVAAAAGQTARVAKSKSMVGRLHSLLMERYDVYRTRRIDLNTDDLPLPGNGTPDWLDNFADSNNDGYSDLSGINTSLLDIRLQPAAGRLAGMREMMRREMPDCWSDVVGRPIVDPPPQVVRILPFLEERPALSELYARAYEEARRPPRSVDAATLLANESAECLYMVIMNATGDGEARGLFQESDSADTDGDGFREFIDGWGRPISYVRWAPGFESDAQLSYEELVPVITVTAPTGNRPRELTAEERIDADSDPSDLFRIDRPTDADSGFQTATNYAGLRGWRLTPLIVSAGADGLLGIELSDSSNAAVASRVDPYAAIDTETWLGSTTDADAVADNVHNHAIATLSRTN